jgi:hypothetical protein
MNIGGVGFYMRMWSKAGFPDLDFPREHHEAIAGDVIDDHERDIRRKLLCDWRQLPKVINALADVPSNPCDSGHDAVLRTRPGCNARASWRSRRETDW